MLVNLSVNHFAIIRDLKFAPDQRLNIITGETGAGKSIILDAFNLILGSRADIKIQSDWGEKCVIEGEFLLDESKFKNLFNEMDVDFDSHTIIRREIATNGKSRTFINDTPVNLQQLKTLGEMLVSIHSQHENTHLNDKAFQFELIDKYANISPSTIDFKQQFLSLKSNESRLNELIRQQDLMLKEKDYLEFLINEFENLQLKENEESMLEGEINVLSNAEVIVQTASAVVEIISESESSIADTLIQLKNKLKTLENISPQAAEIANRLNSSIIELKDIAEEAETLRDSVSADDQKLEKLNERLNAIQSLKRKHGVSEYDELLKVSETIADQLFGMGNLEREIETLKSVIDESRVKLKTLASKIHQLRIKSASKLKPELEKLLMSLEMPHAVIEFELNEKDSFDEYGATELTLKFTANLGMSPQALNKIASGGELSRLALCIRCIEADNKSLNTLIFDEIDTGVSGKVADTIGKMFKQISKNHQVIAITHLPQVAGYGDEHFMVCKKNDGNRTVSYLKHLNQDERIDELANMLSGDTATEIARKNAQELLKA
ncbi:MAG TPA: DNA repair protein RecN [Bacteroidia bacterium]